jgi:predicted XRE-type DNA-binding protein
MSNKRFASIWDAIEDTAAQAENMKLRSALMIALKDRIAHEGLSQLQAAKLFGVTQPRISDLMCGKIDLFGLDTLVNMAVAAGLRVEMRLVEAALSPLPKGEGSGVRGTPSQSKGSRNAA